MNGTELATPPKVATPQVSNEPHPLFYAGAIMANPLLPGVVPSESKEDLPRTLLQQQEGAPDIDKLKNVIKEASKMPDWDLNVPHSPRLLSTTLLEG